MRKKIIAGNWKMNMDLEEGLNLAKSINQYFTDKPSQRCEVILCTPYIHLAGVNQILKNGRKIGKRGSGGVRDGQGLLFL